jgi:hypothetical protein
MLNFFLKKEKGKGKGVAGGWRAATHGPSRGGHWATPSGRGWPLGVAVHHPPSTSPHFFVFFFSFIFKKISLFIYFLKNNIFFIQMDTCRPLIGLTFI